LRPEPLPDEKIDALLEAAGWAPSAHNSQPWRFALVRSADARRALAEAMGARFQADLLADGLPAPDAARRVAASRQRLLGAPLLIVACLAPADLHVYPDAARQQAEWTLGVQSVAAAIQNLLLAADALGLGAGWMCAPLFCPDVVRQCLSLPAGWEPQALLVVGWPAETPAVPPRRPPAGLIVER